MKLTIQKSMEIDSIERWFSAAPPKGGEKQWKKGRSAFEMARFALSDDFEPTIKAVIKSIELPMPHDFICEPEVETRFPSATMGKCGPRNHDLLMVSRNCVIGIEAKVSETFDETIKEHKENASANLLKRIKGFCDILYGEGNAPENLDDLRYQLFSATIGTIIEAEKRDIDNCIMLVVVFEGNITKEKNYDQKVKTNNEDFKIFCRSLGFSDEGGMVQHGETRCWIKKISVTVE